MTNDVPAAAVAQMHRLFEELDAELSRYAVTCRRCGSCCHFGSSGLFLYLSTLEAAVFFQGAHPPLTDVSGEICPYLTTEGCTNRRNRAVGCRTYFCDPKFRKDLEKLHENYIARLKELSDSFGIPWGYSPLNIWLEKEVSAGK